MSANHNRTFSVFGRYPENRHSAYAHNWPLEKPISLPASPRSFIVQAMEQIGKFLRTIKPSAKGIGVFSIGIIIGLAISLIWTSARSPSSLTSGLRSGWDNASSQFDARIRSRFPVGTSAQALIVGLSAEWFKPTWFETESEYGAKRDEGSFACNVAARVFWKVDQNGAVSAIRGTYHEEGCL